LFTVYGPHEQHARRDQGEQEDGGHDARAAPHALLIAIGPDAIAIDVGKRGGECLIAYGH